MDRVENNGYCGKYLPASLLWLSERVSPKEVFFAGRGQ